MEGYWHRVLVSMRQLLTAMHRRMRNGGFFSASILYPSSFIRRVAQHAAHVFCAPLRRALPFVVFLLLVPAPDWDEGNEHMRGVDKATAEIVHKTRGIFSLLQSNGLDLDDGLIWQVAGVIVEESERHSLDPVLVLAVIEVESRFQHKAVSSQGARGLMQIRPFVANALAQEVNLKRWEGTRSLDDPIINIKLGTFYLRSLLEKFRDLKIALTSYERGPTAVALRLQNEEPLPLGYAGKVLSSYRRLSKSKGAAAK